MFCNFFQNSHYFIKMLFISALILVVFASSTVNARNIRELPEPCNMEESNDCELCELMTEKKLCGEGFFLDIDCNIVECGRLRPVDEEPLEGDILGIDDLNEYAKKVNDFVEPVPCDPEEPNCQGHSAVNSPYNLWPNNKVPYTIEGDHSQKEKDMIRQAMDYMEQHTCLRFTERDWETSYVLITDNYGCSSYVGRQPIRQQPQELTLAPGSCFSQIGKIQHELMHAIGFFHEQSRNDRDKFVRVNTKYVQRGKEKNFEKMDLSVITHLDNSYDYNSIMHYPRWAFRMYSGVDTIVPIDKDGDELVDVEIGQRRLISEGDLLDINKLYKCYDYLNKEETTTTEKPKTTEKSPTTEKTTTTTTEEDDNNPFGASNFSKFSRYSHWHCRSKFDRNDFCYIWFSKGYRCETTAALRYYCDRSCCEKHETT